MKRADECKNLEEIRFAIDKIDLQIISLISQRTKYANEALKFKKNKAEVRASERVQKMLKKRRKWAENLNADPNFIEALFKNIVNYFFDEQMRDWDKLNKF